MMKSEKLKEQKPFETNFKSVISRGKSNLKSNTSVYVTFQSVRSPQPHVPVVTARYRKGPLSQRPARYDKGIAKGRYRKGPPAITKGSQRAAVAKGRYHKGRLSQRASITKGR